MLSPVIDVQEQEKQVNRERWIPLNFGLHKLKMQIKAGKWIGYKRARHKQLRASIYRKHGPCWILGFSYVSILIRFQAGQD
jgi:hypothetical protein